MQVPKSLITQLEGVLHDSPTTSVRANLWLSVLLTLLIQQAAMFFIVLPWNSGAGVCAVGVARAGNALDSELNLQCNGFALCKLGTFLSRMMSILWLSRTSKDPCLHCPIPEATIIGDGCFPTKSEGPKFSASFIESCRKLTKQFPYILFIPGLKLPSSQWLVTMTKSLTLFDSTLNHFGILWWCYIIASKQTQAIHPRQRLMINVIDNKISWCQRWHWHQSPCQVKDMQLKQYDYDITYTWWYIL